MRYRIAKAGALACQIERTIIHFNTRQRNRNEGKVGRFRIVDVPSPAWHSPGMRHRRSTRQLLLTIALSQILAIQGLLLAVGGGLAAAGAGSDAVGTICANAAPVSGDGTSLPGQDRHQDCLSACLSGPISGEPPREAAVLTPLLPQGGRSVPEETPLLGIAQARAFLARAPPKLT